ncbi:MAG: hypothetical protein M1819_004650 [Sarea resinae]|nr:MAG: hypothetical protein M1819_004650 [Sarea resinae]
MAEPIPPPDLRSLLPPFLACLSVALASVDPPPALLPLLSPVLRHRLQFLSSTASSPSEHWLPLLCWDAEQGSKLPSVVQRDAFELHPVSGEIELPDVENLCFNQVDDETLRAQAVLEEFGLVVIYLWCEKDVEGGSGWRVAELNTLEDGGRERGGPWSDSIEEARARWNGDYEDDGVTIDTPDSRLYEDQDDEDEEDDDDDSDDDDDDDYWDQYDRTPGRTPAAPRSPVPKPNTAARGRSASEAEYFARYHETEQTIDGEDAVEDQTAVEESTLNGGTIERALLAAQVATLDEPTPTEEDPFRSESSHPPPYSALEHSAPEQAPEEDVKQPELSQPRPSFSSGGEETVARLEETAATQSNSENGVTQHIRRSVRSLYHLAHSAGIQRDEFARVVRTEMDNLSLEEEEE